MEHQYIQPDELPNYASALPFKSSSIILKMLVSLTKRVATVLGFPMYIALPREVAERKNNTEQLRGLRIIKKLQQAGYIKESHYFSSQIPDEPPGKICIHEFTEDSNLGSYGKSAHTSDFDYLTWPALGEAVERFSVYSSFAATDELVQASYKSLKKPKVNIFSLNSFTDYEREQSTAGYRLDYSELDDFIWVPTTEVGTNRTVYAPLQWFSFAYVNSERRSKLNEPLLTPPITTGAAAGQSVTRATLAGLLEVVERDAFMIYWLQQLQAKKIDLSNSSNKEIQSLVELAKLYRLELNILYLETDVPVHTICLLIVDRSGVGPALTVGAKTGFALESIIIDTLQDQLAQRGVAHSLKEKFPDMINVPAHKSTHVSRMLYWHKAEQLPDIEHFIGGELCALADLPQYDIERDTAAQLNHLYDWFAKKNYPIYWREIISPELKDLCEGMSVVLVKVPDMQPLYLDEQLKATGGTRLQSVPKELGLATWFDAHGEYYQVPHPFP